MVRPRSPCLIGEIGDSARIIPIQVHNAVLFARDTRDTREAWQTVRFTPLARAGRNGGTAAIFSIYHNDLPLKRSLGYIL